MIIDRLIGLMLLTVCRCSHCSVGSPLTPEPTVLFRIFAAHLNNINCVWLEVLHSEGLYVISDVLRGCLKK